MSGNKRMLFLLLLFLLHNFLCRDTRWRRGTWREHDGLIKHTHADMDRNGALLALTPLANWKILTGKLSAVVIWTGWGIWLTIPLLALSSYTGGLAVAQVVRCGVVLLVSCTFYALIGMSFALWNPPIRAKRISYGLVLLTTFLPLIPVSPFSAIPMLAVMSPLSALLSILSPGPTHLWLWNIGLFCLLFFLFLPVPIRQMRF